MKENCKYCFITLMILTFLACIFCVQFPFPSTWSGTPKNYFFEMSPLHVHRFALMYTWFMKRQKANSLERIIWSEVGKQNIQALLLLHSTEKISIIAYASFITFCVWLLATATATSTAPLSYVTCLIITQMNRNAILMLSYIQAKWTVMENVHRSSWIIQVIHKTFHQSQFLSQLGRKLHPL